MYSDVLQCLSNMKAKASAPANVLKPSNIFLGKIQTQQIAQLYKVNK